MRIRVIGAVKNVIKTGRRKKYDYLCAKLRKTVFINMADEKIIFSMNGVGKILPHNNRVILKDIYLSFFYGAKIGIVGLNGSGKSKLLISGGVFHYSVGSQGDSTALRLIWGGRFKSFGFMTADDNNTKFWIGTTMATSNVGVYVDKDGYVTTSIIMSVLVPSNASLVGYNAELAKEAEKRIYKDGYTRNGIIRNIGWQAGTFAHQQIQTMQ